MLEIYLPAVYLSNGLAVALCINILLSYGRQIRSSSFDERMFFSMCISAIVQAVVESLVYSLDGIVYPGGRVVLYILSSINFCLSAVISLLFVLYIDYKLFSSLQRIKRHLPFLLIPIAIAFVLAAVNFFVPTLFYISEQNIYQRGPYIWFSFVQVYAYTVYALLLTLLYRRRREKYLFMPVLMYVVPVYIGSILQLLVYGMSFIWVCQALGLTAIYINLQNETSYLDPLTGLYNRTYLFRYLENSWKKQDRLEGLMLDLNEFKQINDTYGHVEGDAALSTVGKLLLRAAKDDCIAARYAGDEFVIVIPQHAHTDAVRVKQEIDREVELHNRSSEKPYKILFSIGICNQPVDTVDEFFSVMDRNMYREKQSFYSQSGHNRRVRPKE